MFDSLRSSTPQTTPRLLTLAACVLAVAVVLAAPLAAGPGKGKLAEEERAALVTMLEEGLAETRALLAEVEGDRFTNRPGEDRWSASEVLEHIALTEEILLGMAQEALAGEPAEGWAQILEENPVVTFTAMIQDRSQRAEAPEPMHPTGTQTLEEGLARLEAVRAQTLAFVQGTEAPVKRHTVATPMGEITVHHVLALIAAHNLRHNQQIAEALE